MSASPMRREAPFAAALASLLLLTLAPAASAAETFGARRTVYYQDAACRLESFREYAYSARSMETDHTTREVAFGECYARGSTGAITTCDPVDGTSTVETYLDTKCQQHLYSSRESPECENLRVDGHSCPAGGPASATSDCASMSIYPTITPGAFNLVGSPYNDRMCEDRAGGDHIVPGEAFGVGNIGCTLSTLVRGPLFSLTECMDDGTVYGKVFGPDDINCSGELHNEVLMFPRAAQTDMTGGICALGVFEDGRREYYRLKACTTKAETPKEPISVTPAPTAHAEMIFFDDDQTNGQPAPVDYRGDGDDEDLRDDSDDDGSSSYHDSGDGKGSHEDRVSEGGSDSKDKDSDDDSGDDHPHEKDHDDHDCDDHHKKDSDDSLSMDHGWRSDDDSGDKHHHHHRDGSSSGDDSTGDDYHHHHGDDDHHDSHHHGDGSDDDDVHSSNGDGSGQGEGGSPHGSADDDGHGHGHGDSDDHGDGGSEERDDDDLDANASGRGGDVDGDGDDGLTGNGVFAIVFGVAVSFAICLLSFVLATTGDNRQKVGPKT